MQSGKLGFKTPPSSRGDEDREGGGKAPSRPAFALLLLATLVIGWPWLSARVTIPWDAKAHFLPQIQFLAQSLAEGQSPFWTPYVFSGHPQVADPQSLIFAPPFLALALVDGAPSLWAVDTALLAMLLLSGAALVVWFRDQGWHWAGGLIAALAFCFGAAMAWRIQHTGQVLSLAYLPLAMLATDRALARGSLLWGFAGGVVTAAIVLGRDQVALLTLYLLGALAVWRIAAAGAPRRALRAALLPLGAAASTALALAAVPLLLTALFAADSNRPAIDYLAAGRGSLHPALLLTLVQPDIFAAAGRMEDYWGPPSFAWQQTGLFVAQNMGVLYLGALPLLLFAQAALRGDLWRHEIRFFTCAAGLALLYALGWYTPVFKIIHELVPGVALFRRPADAAFLVGGLGAILAGYGAHRLFSAPHHGFTGIRSVAGVLAAAGAIALMLAVWLERTAQVVLPLTLAGLAFAASAVALRLVRPLIPSKPALAAALLSAVLTVDLAYNNGPSTSSALPPSTYDVLEPSTGNATIGILKSSVVENDRRRDRIELVGLGFHWPNASLTHGLENTLGYNPLRLALYSKAVGAEDHVGLPEQRKFSPLFPSYRSTLADLLGLRFIASGVPIEEIDHRLRAGDLTLITRTGDGYLYENPRAVDRVRFATQAQSADFARLLRDGEWPAVDLASTVLLEGEVTAQGPRRRGQVSIVSYQNTDVMLEVDSPDGGWAVLNDVWHPWWYVDLDGKPAPLLRANVLFRAVAVPPGHHELRFTFRPLQGGWAELRQQWALPPQD
jgi:hypothetical protein